ncbi:MAG: cation diffusion facilitator family transporter [Gammaproteobacteria bacterium]|nr:cation diffusion facilitator family transporter [Gammaproteobacteria bacterium]
MGHHHHHAPVLSAEEDASDERYRATRNVTLVGSVLDLTLGIAKIVVGTLANSQALVADGIHSLSDLGTDFMVLYAARHAHRKPDREHPYGHGRIETAATVALGIALVAVAAGIAWDSLRRLFDPDLLLQPGPLALTVAIISVLSKEWIYHYTMRVARRLNSNMLKANAWHSRSDAISSIVVVIGIIGVMLGYPFLDAVAAVVVALLIARIGWDLAWSSLRELIDTALDSDEVKRIRDSIMKVDGVRTLHMLRTRRSGGSAFVDVHILVDPQVSVSEGHQIGERVRRTLLADSSDVSDVTVHIDPEDDERNSPCDHLPLREDLLAALGRAWEGMPMAARVRNVTLHYLNGKVHLDLTLPLDAAAERGSDGQPAVLDLVEAARGLEVVGRVRVVYE